MSQISNVRWLNRFLVYHPIRVDRYLYPRLKGATKSLFSRVSGTADSINCQVGLENIAVGPDRVYVR